ncbi:uncharacterized protein SPAPADRAFT_65952 [Spathaspora passalidarum NRRL Y-27907]|uniref:Peptidase S8/S53 domain-containing protein n=1 Tax=Spathaspora passalidarum (strain NRRL Y-27907 / 11-Y1) TaxID=619300 RepID=G3AKH8_SPAPN|nr:uncharacterized protein SPAPADRAFT_65952 [Spathaspora passalidarum NRRL Y-27907]EGW32935.1 hypothetical protein SPAPADRAFT_65952 [Spathaspora passalidarum NRRL Y-27907]
MLMHRKVLIYLMMMVVKVLIQFEGRAKWAISLEKPNIRKDEGGHGTHFAGIIGSRTYEVAKKVDLFAIGTLNGRAVNKATEAGLHIVIAAGNENINACEKSPGREAGPITVGATNSSDASSKFSKFGQCVDIFAPGEDIESTYIGPDVKISSGTSMAAPRIAGIVSYFLSLQPEIWSEFATGLIKPQDLKKRITRYGIRGKITGLDDTSRNILAFNGGGGGGGGNLTDLWMIWWYER